MTSSAGAEQYYMLFVVWWKRKRYTVINQSIVCMGTARPAQRARHCSTRDPDWSNTNEACQSIINGRDECVAVPATLQVWLYIHAAPPGARTHAPQHCDFRSDPQLASWG